MKDHVVYKKKHRPLKVKMLDDSTKKILIDESLPIDKITKEIAEHVGLTNV